MTSANAQRAAVIAAIFGDRPVDSLVGGITVIAGADGRELVAQYNYGSALFIFKVAWKRTYTIIGRDRAMDQKVTREELDEGLCLPLLSGHLL